MAEIKEVRATQEDVVEEETKMTEDAQSNKSDFKAKARKTLNQSSVMVNTTLN